MSVNFRDILRLPCMRGACVLGGHMGLNQEIKCITVQDFFDLDSRSEQIFANMPITDGEVVITSMTDIAQNVSAQKDTLRYLHGLGNVGVLLYYVGYVVPSVSEELIAVADELRFPLICMPDDAYLRYSEAIREITELIIQDQNREQYYLPELLRMVISRPEEERGMERVFRMIAGFMNLSLILTDSHWNILADAMLSQGLSRQAAALAAGVESYIHQGTVQTEDGTLYCSVCTIYCRDSGDLNLLIYNENGPLSFSVLRQLQDCIQIYLGMNRESLQYSTSSALISAALQGNRRAALRAAQKLHLDISSFDSMVIIEPRHCREQYYSQRILREIFEMLEASYPHCVADTYHDSIVVIGPNKLAMQTNIDAMPWYTALQEKDMDAMVYIFGNLSGVEDFCEAYRLLCRQRENVTCLYPDWNILYGANLRTVQQCKELADAGSTSCLRVLAPLDKFEEPLRSELKKTLSVYLLDAYNSVSRTAQLMYLHKNTVQYRIRKINACLGYDVSLMPECAECYMACALERFLSYREPGCCAIGQP